MSVTIRQTAGCRTSDNRNPCIRRHEKQKCETDPVLHTRFFHNFFLLKSHLYFHTEEIPPVKQNKKLVMTAFFPNKKSFFMKISKLINATQ
jgi:hypothetical protein